MDILILATKNCAHRPILERELKDLDVNYKVKYVEDDPEAMEKYQIRNSPNLVVNEEVVFRASPDASLPTDEELKNYLNK
ncbi:MAG: thioredoxin family protein [Melioribacteraceae bacterium]|nr:thioredoxin family protein [Melioribacteraceae bacterium]MDD3558276.1 thioredoxin family protein [Melioribacteraceae bacterium]